MKKQIWLTAAHITGTQNVEADREPRIFRQITDIWGEPSIDLFVSRLNHQVSCYVSWKPDPGAAFPPFSLIARCVQKIQTFSGRLNDSSNVAFPKLVIYLQQN